MQCALCRGEGPLRQSHIVPEFLHRSVYDDRHRTLVLGLERPTKVLQKGVREALLCDACEARFQRYEHYFAELWYRNRRLPTLKAGDFYTLENLDYTKFKLFILSIVWRGSVSRRPEFDGMSLGPHEERIRRMLLANDARSSSDYPVLGGLIIDPEDGMIWDNAMLAPMSIRVSRHNAARMLFGGVSWTVLTSSHSEPRLDPLSLKTNGTLVMPVTTWQEHAHSSGLAELAHLTDVPDLR